MLTLSSIASSTTRTGSISPAIACAARAPIRHPRIDRCATECKKLSASEAPDPGRHQVGTPGDIISECPGDFIGIRTPAATGPATHKHAHSRFRELHGHAGKREKSEPGYAFRPAVLVPESFLFICSLVSDSFAK